LHLALTRPDTCLPPRPLSALIPLGRNVWSEHPASDPLGPGAPLRVALEAVTSGASVVFGTGLRANADGLEVSDPEFACADVESFSRSYRQTGFADSVSSKIYDAMDLVLDIMYGRPDDTRSVRGKAALREACRRP